MLVRPLVLVAFDEDRVPLGDEEAGGWVTRARACAIRRRYAESDSNPAGRAAAPGAGSADVGGAATAVSADERASAAAAAARYRRTGNRCATPPLPSQALSAAPAAG